MRITRSQLRSLINEEARALGEGAVPAAGRWGRQIEAARDQLARLGRRVRVVWNDVGDISTPDTADMLDTDFDIEAFEQQLDALDDQLAGLQVALYDVDS
jgi:hypothetical protein